MNNLKKIVTLVVFFYVNILYADQGAVSFPSTQTYNTDVTSQAIDFDGTYIYVANGTNGILVLNDDLTTPVTAIVDSGVEIVDIVVEETKVYVVGANEKLYAYSFDGTTLTLQDSIQLNGTINDIKVKSNIVYIANDTNGLALVDANTADNLQQLGYINTTKATQMIIVDDVIYLADDWGGLKTLNIKEPSNPILVNTNEGTYISVASEGTALVALSDESTVDTFKIIDRLLPIKQTATPSTIDDEVVKLYAYSSNVYTLSTATTDSIKAYSLLDLVNISLNGTYGDATTPNDIKVVNSFAYISNTTSIVKAEFRADLSDTIVDAIDIGALPTTVKASLPKDENDIDVIQVDTASGVLSVGVSLNEFQNTIKCSIVDASGNTINDINQSFSDGDIVSFNTPIGGGVSYIKIEGLSVEDELGYGNYEVSIELITDDYTDTINSAKTIYKGEEISGNIASSNDHDIFKIYLASKGTLFVSTNSVQVSVGLLGNKEQSSIDKIKTENTTTSFEVPYSGYYFIDLSSNSANYDYSFSYSFNKAVDIYEDNQIGGYKGFTPTNLIDISGKAVDIANDNLYLFTNDTATTTKSFEKRDFSNISASGSTYNMNTEIINDMEIIGKYAYAVLEGGKIAKYDISNATPSFSGAYTVTGENFSKIVVDGEVAYTFSNSKVFMFNISSGDPEPLEPTVGVDSIEATDTINDIEIKYTSWNKDGVVEKTRNPYLYIATTNELKVYSLEENIFLTTYNTELINVQRFKISNDRLYTVIGDEFSIYDINVPVYCSLLGKTTISSGLSVTNIELDENKAYLSPNIQTIDISNERVPTKLTHSKAPDEHQLKVREGMAYTASDSSISLYEVANDYGDSYTTAKEVSINSIIYGNISEQINKISNTGDIDYLKLILEDSGVMDINLTSTNNIEYEIQNSLLSPINTQNLNKGIYYLKIKGTTENNNTDAGDYSIIANFKKDDYTDTIENAKVINFDDENKIDINGTLAISLEDKDYFKIVLPQRGTLDISLSGDADALIELIDEDKTTHYEKDYNTKDGAVVYSVDTTLNPGTYYILVTGDNSDADSSNNQGSYRLEVDFKPTGDLVLNENISYDSLIYGNSFIYTLQQDINKFYSYDLNIYSHILNKVGRKQLEYVNLCSKPFVIGNFIYINDNGSETCDKSKMVLGNSGYSRLDVNLQEDSYESVASKYYEIKKDLYMSLDKQNYMPNSFNNFDIFEDNSMIFVENSTLFTTAKNSTNKLDSVETNYINKVLLDGNILFAVNTNQNKIYVYNISNKSTPVLINTINNYARDIKISGDYLYVYDGSYLNIMDISNLSDIKDTTSKYIGSSYGIDIDGNNLYVRDRYGFEIYDITNKNDIQSIANFDTSSSSYNESDIKYKDNKVYFTHSNYGVYVVDVNDTSNPTQLSLYTQISSPKQLEFSGDYVYITTDNYIYKVHQDSLSDNTSYLNETYVGTINDIDIKNDTIYISSYGLKQYDMDLNSIPTTNIGNYIYDMDTDGTYFYTALSDYGFAIYNISDLTTPLNSVGYKEPYNFSNVAIKENIAYVTSYTNKLRVYDVTDKSNLELINTYTVSNANGILVDENNLYLYDAGTITKYDITTPSTPIYQTYMSVDNRSFKDMITDGNYGYISDHQNGDLVIIRLDTMSIVSSVSIASLGGITDDSTKNILAYKDHYVYIAGSNGVAIVDVTDISNPIYDSTFDDQNINTLAIDNNFIYVGYDYGIKKYNITVPNTPILEEHGQLDNRYNYDDSYYNYDTNSFSTSQMIIKDQNIYAKDGSSIKTINLNHKYETSYSTNISNLNIVHGDDKYIYEYGKISTDYFGQSIEKFVLNRISTSNNTDIYYAKSEGYYLGLEATPTIVKSMDEVIFVAMGNTLDVIKFTGATSELVTSIVFENDITHIETLADKKSMYIHLEGSHYIKVYDCKDIHSIEKVQEFDTNAPLNSIAFRYNKAYVSSPGYGVKIFYTNDDGLFIHQKDIENIGVEVDDLFSVDNSTLNYTALNEKGERELKVFILRDTLTDGINDSVYSRDTPKEGCFIATAGYGSYFEPNVKVLRDFRDTYLKTNTLGQAFVDVYYTYSPAIATAISQNEFAKGAVRMILTPVVYTIKYPLILVLMMVLFIGYKLRKHLTSYFLPLISSILLLTSLTGCGSGSTYEKEKAPEVIVEKGVGYFVDAPVAGVFYKSGLLSGITDENGTFEYDNTSNVSYDRSVQFTIGNIKLGAIEPEDIANDTKVLPTDLLGVNREDTNNSKVVLMLQLLQSLDEDGNSSNGISVSKEDTNKLELSGIDFSDDITSIETDLNTTILNVVEKQLISKLEAKVHFEQTLRVDFGSSIDTVGPINPTFTQTPPTLTNQDSVTVVLSSEVGASIFVNDIDTNTTISKDGTASFDLNTSGQDGVKDFIIVLKDTAGNKGEELQVSITKDTVAPVFTTPDTYLIENGGINIAKIDTSDTSSVSYSLSGVDASSFYITNTGELNLNTTANFDTKSSYSLSVVATDGYNSSTQELTITVQNPYFYIEGVYGYNEGVYKSGSTINIRLPMSMPVYVTASTATNIPYIEITIDGQTKQALYTGSTDGTSSVSNLYFEYAIEENLKDENPISIGNNIVLNGATITDASGVYGELYPYYSVVDSTNTYINSIDPYITSVDVPASDYYYQDDILTFTLHTNSDVNITGEPQLLIGFDSGTGYAMYDKNTSTSNTLVFNYTITSEDIASNGISLTSNIQLNGAIIQDINENNIILTFDDVSTYNIYVDGTYIPEVTYPPTNITLSQTNIAENNPSYSFVADITTTDSDSDTFTYTMESFGDSSYFYISGSILNIYDPADYETKQSYNISIKTSDGVNEYSKAFTITVDDIKEATTIALSETTYTTSSSGNRFFGMSLDETTQEIALSVYTHNTMLNFDIATQSYTDPLYLPNISNPHGIVKDGDTVYAADLNNATVRKYIKDTNSTSYTEINSVSVGEGNQPVNLILNDTTLYIADRVADTIYIMDKTDMNITDSISFTSDSACIGDGHIDMAYDSGYLYVVKNGYGSVDDDCGINGIAKIDTTTNTVQEYITISNSIGTQLYFNGITIVDNLIYLNTNDEVYITTKDGSVLDSWAISKPTYDSTSYIGIEVTDDSIYLPMGRGEDNYHIQVYENKLSTPTITNVVYDDKQNTEVYGDMLYVYFNTPIDHTTILSSSLSSLYYANAGVNISFDGNETATYDSVFNRQIITLSSNTLAPTPNSTQIVPYPNTITDTSGEYVVEKSTMTTALTPVKQTGQNSPSDGNYTDGYYQKGVAPNYTRVDEIVTDHITGLMWQDDTNTSSVTKPWVTQENYDASNYEDTSGDTATTYCSTLSLGGYSDWRVPTIEELEGIVDFSRYGPAINPVFTNVSSSYYWSSSTNVYYTYIAWYVYFYSGNSSYSTKSTSNYVRCVRGGQ